MTMSIVKSYSFPKGDIRGDTFYIKHNVDAFTVIDCYLLANSKYEQNNRQQEIIDEIVKESAGRLRRFISTHPDKDHIAGIEELFRRWPTNNFYAVENAIPSDADDISLSKYIELKDKYNYAIERGIERRWLNKGDEERKSCGIQFLWPSTSNEFFKEALLDVANGGNANNICPIFTYSVEKGAKYMWMGDLESDMQQVFYDTYRDTIPEIDILFQPHHGRSSASVPDELLKVLNPKLIIIGNAPCDCIDYGDSCKTLTQNTSGDLLFDNRDGYVHIYSQNKVNNLPACLSSIPNYGLNHEISPTFHYCGSLKV